MKTRAILLTHASQLLTLCGDAAPRRGAQMRDLGIIEDGAVLIADGKILAVGATDELHTNDLAKSAEEIECRDKVVLPGFVDSHTHPVFANPRLIDFEKRIAGASYEEIADAGGGIRASIRGVRESSTDELAAHVLHAFGEMAAHGTTTVEAKSGYGLDLASEIKSLEAIRLAAGRWPGTVVSTLLGGHVVPPEYRERPDEYVRIVCEEMIPAAAGRGLKPAFKVREGDAYGTPAGVPFQNRGGDPFGAPEGVPLQKGEGGHYSAPEGVPLQGTRLALYVDVFCERGAFTPEQSVRILREAVAHGLKTRIHVGQLTHTDLNLFAEFNCASFDHMDHVSDADIRMLAQSDTVATLLPAANYFLGLSTFPPARRLIDAGVAVALATDYNPGTSPTTSMPFVLSAACTHMKMSPAEAITAATINGACALQMHDKKGSLEPGKDADIAIFDASDYREIAYWVGVNRCSQTLLKGWTS
jgi:imidazolonepropionase